MSWLRRLMFWQRPQPAGWTMWVKLGEVRDITLRVKEPSHDR